MVFDAPAAVVTDIGLISPLRLAGSESFDLSTLLYVGVLLDCKTWLKLWTSVEVSGIEPEAAGYCIIDYGIGILFAAMTYCMRVICCII